MKICSRCKIEKSLDLFYKASFRSSGFRSRCKSCMDELSKRQSQDNPGPSRKAKSNYKNNNPDKNKDISLRYKYGIGIEKYKQMLEEQQYKCAICFRPERFFSPKVGKLQDLTVDHCHSTGKIRGLLCRTCNSALGKYGDSIEMLNSAILYLKKAR